MSRVARAIVACASGAAFISFLIGALFVALVWETGDDGNLGFCLRMGGWGIYTLWLGWPLPCLGVSLLHAGIIYALLTPRAELMRHWRPELPK